MTNPKVIEHAAQDAQPKVLSKDEARNLIFNVNKKTIGRESFTFNGVDMDFIQPTVGKMYKPTDGESRDDKAFIVQAMIDNSVLAGTDEKVFEDTDYDSIMEMPMNPDMRRVTDIINKFFNLSTDKAVGN